ncbi:MAG: tRNA preQ1(34) S-adenosylmethionine ribosyltransferase-isomerase QueA [Bdellovibrionota bacterium]
MREITFDLPGHLVATQPTARRDACKLLVYHRQQDRIEHKRFYDIKSYLQTSDHLVFNHAKVSPKRVYWVGPSQRKHEIVFLRLLESDTTQSTWEVILSGKKLKEQQPYILSDSDQISFRITKRLGKIAHVELNCTVDKLEIFLATHGLLPLPPYILKSRRESGQEQHSLQDQKDYQTVYAAKSGAAAAPTAGLHFTKELIQDIQALGVHRHDLFLEVGWGTFAPLTEKNFTEKKLHQEYIEIDKVVTSSLLQAKVNKQKVIGVGTTVARSLETWASYDCPPVDFHTTSDLFIYPPYRFQVLDAMITNFHLSGSSLLLLVAAFLGEGGVRKIIDIYREAVQQEYRFYSYGDAMLIL